MEKGKFGSKWVFIMGILIVILGIIHNGATPLISSDLDILPKNVMLVMIFMFVGTGTAIIFAGLLTIYCSFGLKKSERMAWVIAMGVGVFIGLLGIGAVITMPNNPFAYIMSAFSILVIIPLLIHRKQFKKDLKI
ncbi:MAG: hypothetical protein ACE5KE_10060 [Methanosarcinales archaeon]